MTPSDNRILPPDIYLVLHTLPNGATASVSVAYDEAISLDRKGFANLYRRHVCGASRKEAKQWADRQIALRAEGGWASRE